MNRDYIYINIVRDFSMCPGGRYIEEGENSAEEFRDKILIPKLDLAILTNKDLYIELGGTYGYSSAFLEETFGGLIRKGYDYNEVLKILHLSDNDNSEENIKDIISYIIESGKIKRNKKLINGGII